MRHPAIVKTMVVSGLVVWAGLSGGMKTAYAEFNGGAEAALKGGVGPLMNWPILGIHVILLPDGRVFNYGTNQLGAQGGQFKYDIWNPNLGAGPAAHLLLDNTTSTDIFCGAQALVPATGQVLLTGGDLTIKNARNFASPDINFFDHHNNTLTPGGMMQYPRWYPTLITLASGEMMALGGRMNFNTLGSRAYADTPEVYSPGTGWRVLTGASQPETTGAYGESNWYYPRAWQAPNGKVFILSHKGGLYYLDPTGTGSITKIEGLSTTAANPNLTAVMYAPGKILALRHPPNTVLVDINGDKPTVAPTTPPSQPRFYSTATVLADGKVLLSGGSRVPNVLDTVAYHTELWDPATQQWSIGASLSNPRLYHSTALLLPDASVLITGGGAPGPLTNLNAEIYYPPYLFKRDGSGQLAPRPSLGKLPTVMNWNIGYKLALDSDKPIQRLTLLRSGSMTHNWNMEQRFLELNFRQQGRDLFVTSPANANLAPPGYYLLFAFDADGVPSVGKILRVNSL